MKRKKDWPFKVKPNQDRGYAVHKDINCKVMTSLCHRTLQWPAVAAVLRGRGCSESLH